MEQPVPGIPSQPQRRAPWKAIGLIVLLLAVAAAAYLLLTRRAAPPAGQPQPGPAATGTAEANLQAAQNVERERNLAAIHDLIAAYRGQLNAYPERLEDLLNYKVRGKTTTFATRVVEAKLEGGAAAYTYTRQGDSYQLCAQQVGTQPKCETAP